MQLLPDVWKSLPESEKDTGRSTQAPLIGTRETNFQKALGQQKRFLFTFFSRGIFSPFTEFFNSFIAKIFPKLEQQREKKLQTNSFMAAFHNIPYYFIGISTQVSNTFC